MAWNDHRNLAGFICGFVLGKLSTALKWYSVKMKEMYTQVENAVFANFPFLVLCAHQELLDKVMLNNSANSTM